MAVVVGVVPERPRWVVSGDPIPVGAGFAWFDHDEDVVAVAFGRDVQPVGVQVGHLVEGVLEGDGELIAGPDPKGRPGSRPVVGQRPPGCPGVGNHGRLGAQVDLQAAVLTDQHRRFGEVGARLPRTGCRLTTGGGRASGARGEAARGHERSGRTDADEQVTASELPGRFDRADRVERSVAVDVAPGRQVALGGARRHGLRGSSPRARSSSSCPSPPSTDARTGRASRSPSSARWQVCRSCAHRALAGWVVEGTFDPAARPSTELVDHGAAIDGVGLQTRLLTAPPRCVPAPVVETAEAEERCAASSRADQHASQHVSPRHASRPSRTARPAMTRAAIGSAHHHPSVALASRPTSRMAER